MDDDGRSKLGRSKGDVKRTRALLLDFDGVLRHFPGQDELARGLGLPDGAVSAAAFAPSRLGPALIGQIRDEQWRREIVAELRRDFPDARAEEAVRRWSEPAGQLDHALLSLLQQARADMQIVLVTNATTRLGLDLERLGIVDIFDVVVSSAELGVAKPDARFFGQALMRAGVAPNRALFVDDSVRNVEAASALGMAALHFAGAESLRRELVSFARGAREYEES